ncbi:MAG: hypothetical protein O3C40_19695 [Planctomycetota bacterium]|nr:hypothetical protein [Planctomycetota bacterium]
MADDFKAGDRVIIRNGEFGTIIRIDGGLVQVLLDSSLRKTAAKATLRKIESESDDKDK